jgi:hypothetical protein
MDQQPFLFSEAQMRSFGRPTPPTQPDVEMDKSALKDWKQKIAEFQAQVHQQQVPAQISLWESEGTSLTARIDPFQLDFQNFFFFHWPIDRNPSEACLYFVVDTATELLLYIGETCQVNKRWAGYHDCKRYILNYQSAHFQHQIRATINIGFWWDTPKEERPRQRIEKDLIKMWRSPFNKENWSFWGTPFVQH